MADMLSLDKLRCARGGNRRLPLRTSMVSRKLVIVATLPPLHPGEVLREEFLKPMELTPYAVAKACGVPPTRIERIAPEELGISADTALPLGRFFAIQPQFCPNLQTPSNLLTPLTPHY